MVLRVRTRAEARRGSTRAARDDRLGFGRSRPIAALPSRDQQAGERRRQLVHIASDLVEAGGADAVTLPAVAERAGCARTLVYRYFASREDLLAGVLRDYVDRLDARISEPAQRAAVATFLAASQGADTAPLRDLIAAFWEVQVAAGLGGAILRATPPLSRQIEALVDDSRKRFERRITDPLRTAGLSKTESEIAVDLMIGSFVGLALRWRAGEIAADQAIDIHVRATVGLLRGLLGTGTPAARKPAPRPRAARSVGRASKGA